MDRQCQVLYQSDLSRCPAAATSKNGLFCQYHARQCFGLYKGYKRRNAQLDELTANPPEELRDNALNQFDPSAIEDENILERIHTYLSRRFALLDRVIRARHLHHSHFYALEIDYGHENYLNQLSAQRTPLVKTIEKVVKRLAEVLYRKRKWFEWVRDLEDEEEKERDAEKKRIKQEAALFKRHSKEVEARTKKLRAGEDEKAQSEYLNRVWEEQQAAQGTIDETNVEDSWDPIEDSIEDERGNYVQLLSHFLWLQSIAASSIHVDVKTETEDSKDSPVKSQQVDHEDLKSKNAKKRARQKARNKVENEDAKEPATPGKVQVESAVDLRKRLSEGQDFKNGIKISDGPWHNPTSYQTKTSPRDVEEIDKIIEEVTEIKQLLFCRLLLGRATLLPIALHSNNVDEFLANPEVSNTDLRDLCLKMEQPGLQELRDACADLKREEKDEDSEPDDIDTTDPRKVQKRKKWHAPNRLLKPIQTEREQKLNAKRERTEPREAGMAIDFGIIDDGDQFKSQKITIKICGRNIYNYPSESAMSRGGWFQFSIMAKDCRLEDAVRLCRNWDEFYELIVLTGFNYFPASSWLSFLGSQDDQQLFKLGFFPVKNVTNAEDFTAYRQSSRNQGPRHHQVIEMRNWICGLMRRNDPVSRRFIQYAAMQGSSMIVFVRDVSTGQILVSPPSDETWLLRVKVGMGRAIKNEWNILRSVDSTFIENLDQKRNWSLDFKEYYEVIIWDLEPGDAYPVLYNNIQASLFKARRVKTGQEIYKPAEAILRTVTRAHDSTYRARDLQPGDTAPSVWDDLTSSETKHKLIKSEPDEDGAFEDFPDIWVYNEVDRLEDEVLFPWEQSNDTNEANNRNFLAVQQGPINGLDGRGHDIRDFILDLDTDEELSDHGIDVEESESEDGLAKMGINSDSGENSPNQDADEVDDIYSAYSLLKDYEESGRQNEAESRALTQMIAAHDEWEETTERRRAETGGFATMKWDRRSEKAQFDDLMNEEYELFQERGRAAAFKEAWHKADLEPGSQQKWSEYQSLSDSLLKWVVSSENGAEESYKYMGDAYKLLASMGLDYGCHRRFLKDARLASSFISQFFETSAFLATQTSLIFNQAERKTRPPDRRSILSNRTRPREQFKQWDARKGKEPRYLEEWEMVLRPAIAHLYREGVIGTAYMPYYAGRAVCLTEPGLRPDLYFDWRKEVSYYAGGENVDSPYAIDPLLDRARIFAKQFPEAKFSVLKVWSASHFWPLMLGVERREFMSFADSLERVWHWKFIPKDMPYAEWSIHKTLKDRIDSYELLAQPRDAEVISRIDTVLIMAKDVPACQLYTTAATFAINSKTWRLEVDPWKSWINVDIDFLKSLGEKWW